MTLKCEIRSKFLALSSYFCQFIRGFANITELFQCLLKKNIPFKWTVKYENVFSLYVRRQYMLQFFEI